MDEEGALLDFLAHPPFGVGERSAADDRCLLNVGQRVDVWTVTGLLGRGGQGEVYRAVDDRGLPVAIKILRRMESAARARFTDEVRTMMWVGPSVLPQVYAEGQWNDHPYVVMELLEPVEIPTDERKIAGYLISVCMAVAKLHRQGLVHRDLTPANIMQRGTGNIVLVDVGLAKDIARMPRPREGVTRVEGELVGMGTPGYAAPEQLTGGEISVRTDIHALGMLARTAFQLRAEERGRAFAEDEIPRVWRPILARATSSVAEQRYASVGDLEKAIRRRHLGRRMALGGLVTSLVGLLLVGGGLWWTHDEPRGAAAGRRGPWLTSEEMDERRSWARLCETVVTNEVEYQPLPPLFVTNEAGRVDRLDRYLKVTNRVTLTRVSLAGTTNVFRRPILLAEGGLYQIVGPGFLDATFETAGTNTVVRLQNCEVHNRTRTPLERGGVFYRIVGRGTVLDFRNLKEPWRHPPQYPQYDSAYNSVKYGVPEEKEPDPLERKGELSSENF